jgi:carbamoyltransferase
VLILGISGGQYLPQEVSSVVPTWQHDAAAVLIEDGRVVAGIEEERLNRIKHTNRAPLYASRFCLRERGITGRDLDAVAFYWDHAALVATSKMRFLLNPQQPVLRDPRTALRDFLALHLDIDLPPERVHFVPHHMAHAVSALAMSGFDRSLIVTLDGQGERDSGLVAVGTAAGGIRPIVSFPIRDSLGYLYQELIMFLGYKLFDEYKVMGLAPYGDPARYREAFKTLYSLRADGRWRLHRDRLTTLYEVITPRRKGAEFTQAHKDFAAGVQETLEAIVLHMLTHQQARTRERHLCLAGGVAHNCTMNGRIVASGLFDQVFVQPAAHDAGAALGAALHVYLDETRRSDTPQRRRRRRPAAPVARLEHLYWGTDIGSDAHIRRTLESWGELLAFEQVDDICTRAATLLANGRVLGWAQGRSEFGPRALGNRSIIADPRPAANKALINAMVKKREGYRPFAPSVLVDDAAEYFVMPAGVTELPFMIVVVDVREDKRELLGAVTHIDGSARVQTVSQDSNERYWRLIRAFKELTGVPVVLNTSFNNHVEPIVDSAEDAIVCFLTTSLHYLAIGNWLVRKKRTGLSALQDLVPSLPAHYRLSHTRSLGMDWKSRRSAQLLSSYDVNLRHEISEPLHDVLLAADGRKTVREICSSLSTRTRPTASLLGELSRVWSARAITLRPSRTARRRVLPRLPRPLPLTLQEQPHERSDRDDARRIAGGC